MLKFLKNAPEKPPRSHRVLAIDIPQSDQVKEYLTGVFYPYGDITVCITKPGCLPKELKQWVGKVPDLGHSRCAVIHFETARAAKFAVHVLRKREHIIGFRMALLKPGLEDVLYKHQTKSPDHLLLDSGVSSEDQSQNSESENSESSGITTDEIQRRMLTLVKQILE
jgi:hypothetical protein